MKVLSLFDGISCARVALDRLGYKDVTYYASEIDKYAIQIAQKNWPQTIQVGSVVGLDCTQFTDIDLMIGGFPCTNLSIAKKNREGLKGSESGLFYEMIRVHKEVMPRYFVYENVASMAKDQKEIILKTIQEIDPTAYVIMIDAALVSAQRRKRLFFTNIPGVTLPEDRGILLKDILEDGDTVINPKMLNFKGDTEKSMTITATAYKEPPMVLKTKSNTIRTGGRGSGAGDKHDWESVYQYRRTYWRETKGGKVPTLTANMGTVGNNVPYVAEPVSLRNRGEGKKPEYNGTGKANALATVNTDSMVDMPPIRKLTPIECERLMGLDDEYTSGVSKTQRYKMLGNGFSVPVVAHILSYMKGIDS